MTNRSTMGATSEKSYPTVVVGGVDVGRVVTRVESVALVTVASVASDVVVGVADSVAAGPDGSGAVAVVVAAGDDTERERAEEHAVGGTAEPLTDRCHNRLLHRSSLQGRTLGPWPRSEHGSTSSTPRGRCARIDLPSASNARTGEHVVGIYGQRMLPRIVDIACGSASLVPLRRRACAGLHGHVVEIGFGSGHNVGCYPPAVSEVTAIEPSDRAWQLAGDRLADSAVPVHRAGLDGRGSRSPTVRATPACPRGRCARSPTSPER